MGLLDKIFGKKKQREIFETYFKTFNAYTPVFTTFNGGVYEMQMTRTAIHSFATHCSKLKPEVQGTALKGLERVLQYRPNPFMDTTKFIYRLATILSVNNTAFIVPILDDAGGTITGFYPLLPERCEVLEYNGQLWLRYWFANGSKAAIEFERVGIMTQYQYRDDFFGESNDPLIPTMQLIHAQNQGMRNSIKQTAAIRFMGRLSGQIRPEDLEAERENFSKTNLSSENDTGMLIFDNKYADVKQIVSKPYLVDAEQTKNIQENVNNYFGTNTDILQNKFNEDGWNAYYEGKIEPFALQLSLVMTNMCCSDKQIAYGNGIYFTANRMQYASNATKLQVSTQLFDRGILRMNDVMDIWNLPRVEDGDRRMIRLEYTEVGKENQQDPSIEDPPPEPDGSGAEDRAKETSRPTVYAVDFDGTLCESMYPKIGAERSQVVEFVKKRKSEGDVVILWTCREGNLLDDAIEWCQERGVEFDAVNENTEQLKKTFGSDPRKIGADWYIEDKGMHPDEIEGENNAD